MLCVNRVVSPPVALGAEAHTSASAHRAPNAEAPQATWRGMARDGAVIATSTALQAGAFLWTYKHHTPALTHIVAAAAVSQMLLPLANLTFRHLRAETAGLAPRVSGPWEARIGWLFERGAFVLQAVWVGVSYGLWFGALASQFGVASVWGPPLAIGTGVLGITCVVAVGVHLLLAEASVLELDTQAIGTWLRLKCAWVAADWRSRIDMGLELDACDADRQAQKALKAQQAKMWRKSVAAAAHPRLWRNELVVGIGLGIWQGCRVAQGHIGVRGALTGVTLLFPLTQAVFRPLSQGAVRPLAVAQGRFVLTQDREAHAVGQSAMRLGLAAALWAAKPI